MAECERQSAKRKVKGIKRTYGHIISGWILLSLFLFVLAPSYAQPRLRTPEHWVGVHGGVSASSVDFDPKPNNMSPITKACVLGGNGGFVFRYAGHKYCGLQLELNYQHHGWREHHDSIGTYTRSLHYIEFPMLVHINAGSDICKWFLNVGPQVGYCIKDEGNHGTLVNGEDQVQYGELKNSIDWGILAGTGFYVITPHAGVYQFEVRFDYSFGGIFGTGLSDHYNITNPMDLSINLGWLMPVRAKRKQKLTTEN